MKTLILATVVFILTITLSIIVLAVTDFAFKLEQKYGEWAWWLVVLLFLFGLTFVAVIPISGTINIL